MQWGPGAQKLMNGQTVIRCLQSVGPWTGCCIHLHLPRAQGTFQKDCKNQGGGVRPYGNRILQASGTLLIRTYSTGDSKCKTHASSKRPKLNMELQNVQQNPISAEELLAADYG